MRICTNVSRRGFLKTSVLAGLAATAAPRLAKFARAADLDARLPSRVGLAAGEDHVQNTVQALKPFSTQIAQAIGNRTVVIKPNNVAIDIPLSATPAECLEGILEFLKSIGKAQNAVIAESAANGPTLEGFANYHYDRLAKKYGVKLVDLDQEKFGLLHVFDQQDFRPHAVRMSRLVLDPDTFIISAARMKTHDRIGATLSLKNLVVGAAIKDPGFCWGPTCKPGAKNDKPITHGSSFRALNYNLYDLARHLHPHLAVIDGYQGMQGNGPTGGKAVEHRVCVASPDWLAADRLAVELMGIDFAKIGYLNYCAQAGLGEADLKRIEVIGEPVARHIQPYKVHDNFQDQMIWMKPPKVT